MYVQRNIMAHIEEDSIKMFLIYQPEDDLHVDQNKSKT
jgi:hypothetical protein